MVVEGYIVTNRWLACMAPDRPETISFSLGSYMVIFQKAPPPKPQNLVEKTGPWNINNYAIKSCTRRLEICSMQVH